MDAPAPAVPVMRVIARLDGYLGKNDYPAAERHLRYWLAEADAANDVRSSLTLLNEQIGLYRKLGREHEAMEAIDAALSLAGVPEMDNTVSLATTLINAATAYKAFGKASLALPLFHRAEAIYESVLAPDDGRLAGLYNNMAVTLTELADYRAAEDLFNRALAILSGKENGEAEMAVTYLNLADLAAAEKGPETGEEEIFRYLDEAERLLDTDTLTRDGNYAFVCEKCAPVFGYYGYFMTERRLSGRAREIYERA